MRSKWSDEEAAGFVARYGDEWGEPLALRTYSSRLLGAEPSLVLHGGGNSSVKAWWTNVLGEDMAAVFVKASGADMVGIEPAGFPGLDLDYLRRLRGVSDLDDSEMAEEFRTHLLRAGSPSPSIEALVHAFLPDTYIDHTHADAILALTNRDRGEVAVKEALGEDVIVMPYVTPGFKLALATIAAREARPSAWGIVWVHHGIVTWADTARESYEVMVNLVTRAEHYVAAGRVMHSSKTPVVAAAPAGEPLIAPQSKERAKLEPRLAQVAPILRGLLAEETGDCDRPYRRVVVQALSTPDILAGLSASWARQVLVTTPLTSDHLIRTKALPLWVDDLDYEDEAALHGTLEAAVKRYCEEYKTYLTRHAAAMPAGVEPFDPRPRVVMIPGLGVFCAGPDLRESTIARDITEHTLRTKASIGAAGAWYRGLPEEELFAMEYRTLQHAKLGKRSASVPLRGHVALVTGAAGAIGTGICQGLLEAGCLVAATDLPGEPLDNLVAGVGSGHAGRIIGLPLDVTDAASVAAAFAQVARTWGGVDLVVPNAGLALVGPLTELSLERYRKLEQVNVEGTLLVLAEAARLFKRQGTGGDIVLVSTKNVFSPGAGFGAYSSTKAAAHQLARIASLELAADDVRVNMVSPDAVFACGTCRSGLWAEVGPDRMKARGLDEAGLEAYYQNRNLLKAQVTAAHVANAVLFFATRQTPTTGATIPVDGGLPDSTPR
jgi:rhamnose utilization protein RhaD (predicted bifunctional aldolase and dehydrogenase)/NAD(P)-dependent dehydrogenase (short-subunit alcohol dehydrogenase family)